MADGQDGTKSFVNVSIGNRDGQLEDVSVNNTGTYTASFDGSNVSLTNSEWMGRIGAGFGGMRVRNGGGRKSGRALGVLRETLDP